MTGQPTDHLRDVVVRVATALSSNQAGVLERHCAPQARWWTPLEPAWVEGPAAVDRAARAPFGTALDQVRSTIESVVVSEEKGMAVVELSVPASNGSGTAPVTLVMHIDDGRLVSGLTYLDIRAFGQLHDKVAPR
jgi:ketosteroid isomerase-like protein